MRLLYSLYITAAVATETLSFEQKHVEINKSKQAGSLFKQVFDQLAELYSSEKPANDEDMMRDSSNVLASLCTENDFHCYQNMFNLAEKVFEDMGEEPQEIMYPDDFDPKLMMSMENVESMLQQLNLDNTDTVLNDLVSTRTKIESMDDVSDVDKKIALIGADIAVESAKVWKTVYMNPSHPLFGIHYPSFYFNTESDQSEKKERKLNDIDMAAITLNDFQAGFNRAMEQMAEGENVMISAVARSFLASTARCGGGYYYYGTHYGGHGHGHGTTTVTTTTGNTTTTTTTTSHTQNTHSHYYGYYYSHGHGAGHHALGTHGHGAGTTHDSTTHHHHNGYYYHSGYYYNGHGHHSTAHTHDDITTAHTHGDTTHTHGNVTHSHGYYYY